MGFLSKTKVESPFESFYGTNAAGEELNLSEMSEGQVIRHSFLSNLLFDTHPLGSM